jgi:hypothetical protein
MRRAELAAALVLAAASLGLMWKSAELPIGWIPGEGPGGGAFPFWLSAGMLVCCGWVVANWVRRASPPARATQPCMDRQTLGLFLVGAGSLTVMIGLVGVVGIYGATPLFLLFYHGINFLVLAIGVYGIGEILWTIETSRGKVEVSQATVTVRRVIDAVRALKDSVKSVLIGSLLG